MMRPAPRRCAWLATVLLSLVACGPAKEQQREGLVLGLVPSLEAQKLVTNLKPLGDFLAGQLGVPVETFVPQDYTGLIEALGSGRADIAMLPPFAAMLGKERYGIETILISVRNGRATYRTMWMTADPAFCDVPPSPDEQGMLRCEAALEKVRGKTVAFTDPTSTSGYLFPALQLRDLGIDPEKDIQPVFVGSHDASVIAVLNGDVEIGVAYDDARHYILGEYPDIGQHVFPFAYSDWIPNDGVQVRGDLPEEQKAAIRDAFLELTRQEASLPQTERLLYRLYEIDGFEVYEPGLYGPVEHAFRVMRDKIDING